MRNKGAVPPVNLVFRICAGEAQAGLPQCPETGREASDSRGEHRGQRFDSRPIFRREKRHYRAVEIDYRDHSFVAKDWHDQF